MGDPSAGITVMSRAKFEAAWNGIYFVLSQDQQRAKQRFNRAAQWAAYPRAPIGTPFSDPVSQQALALTAPARGDILMSLAVLLMILGPGAPFAVVALGAAA